MTGRFAVIAESILPAKVIADVGCDHGLIAEYCCKQGLAERVIASDISESCLDKARKLLSGISNVTFTVCDGIGYACDEAVIAGMGGALICDILERAHSLPETLILCPHRNAESVRKKLCELGYTIDRDELCKDRGKFYFVIRGRKTARCVPELNDLQLFFGLNFDKKCELLQEYMLRSYNTYMRAPEHNREMLALIETVMKYQDVCPPITANK